MTRPPDAVQDRLDAVMAVFAHLDTTDLIYEAALHTGEFEDGADETRQLGPVIGASYALNKVLYYLDALDRAEEERLAVGKEIARLRGEANGQRSSDPVQAAQLDFLGFTLAGRQEVAWHQFTVWVTQISRLLELVTGAAGASLAEVDRAYLDTFRVLRNHFEHLNERLPGREKGGRLVIAQPDDQRLMLGLQGDEMGRIVVNGTPVDVTGRGRDQVRQIVARTVERIRDACLARLREHFAADPDRIPSPESIGINLRRTLA